MQRALADSSAPLLVAYFALTDSLPAAAMSNSFTAMSTLTKTPAAAVETPSKAPRAAAATDRDAEDEEGFDLDTNVVVSPEPAVHRAETPAPFVAAPVEEIDEEEVLKRELAEIRRKKALAKIKAEEEAAAIKKKAEAEIAALKKAADEKKAAEKKAAEEEAEKKKKAQEAEKKKAEEAEKKSDTKADALAAADSKKKQEVLEQVATEKIIEATEKLVTKISQPPASKAAAASSPTGASPVATNGIAPMELDDDDDKRLPTKAELKQVLKELHELRKCIGESNKVVAETNKGQEELTTLYRDSLSQQNQMQQKLWQYIKALPSQSPQQAAADSAPPSPLLKSRAPSPAPAKKAPTKAAANKRAAAQAKASPTAKKAKGNEGTANKKKPARGRKAHSSSDEATDVSSGGEESADDDDEEEHKTSSRIPMD
jgi:hypothetical protein